jgi:hypothetical protein
VSPLWLAFDRARRLLRAGWLARRARRQDGRELARRALWEILGQSRGLTLKIGQLLAGREHHFELAAAVAARPLSELRPGLEATYGRPLSDTFPTLSEARAAASLGQVHHGRLVDGREVAVKIRYPDIRAAVAAELRLAGLVPGLGPARRWDFDVEGYRRALAADLERELDYRGEAARQARFRAAVEVPGLVVPEVVPELVREAVLVQSWEAGEPLEAARDWPLRARAELTRTLLATHFTSLFAAGLLHADPNPGNLFVRRPATGPAELVLLDYGCVLELPVGRRAALLELIVAVHDGLDRDPLAGWAALGFDAAKLATLGPRLGELTRLLFEPFLFEGPFDPAAWRLGERVEALLGDLKWWFRSAGPPELLFLLRAFEGLVDQLRVLDVRLPWWPLLERAAGAEALAAARRAEPQVPRPTQAFAALAQHLRLRVEEGGRERVDLALPAVEALRLEQIVPAPVQRAITRQGIDLGVLVARLASEGLRPGPVFELRDGRREVRVWLE